MRPIQPHHIGDEAEIIAPREEQEQEHGGLSRRVLWGLAVFFALSAVALIGGYWITAG